MNKFVKIAACALIPMGSFATGDTEWYPVAQAPEKVVQERKLFWILEDGLNGDGDWEATAKYAKENGYTDVIARLARGGVAFYESKVVPVSPVVREKGDLLRKAVAACHKYGIRLHAWKVFWRLNMAPDDYVKKALAEDRVIYGRALTPFSSAWRDPSGKIVKGEKNDYWLCPADPRNREEEKAVMLEMASLGVDGVHFDYIRYNAWYGCYCSRCRAAYEKRMGKACAHWPQDVDPMVQINPLWLKMRCETITSLVRETAAEVKKAYPSCEVSAAVFPGVDEHIYHAQPWHDWCREGILDFVCPMTYYRGNDDLLREKVIHLVPTMQESPKTRIYPSVGVVNGKTSAEEVDRQADIVRWAGFPGVSYYILNKDSAAGLKAR